MLSKVQKLATSFTKEAAYPLLPLASFQSLQSDYER